MALITFHSEAINLAEDFGDGGIAPCGLLLKGFSYFMVNGAHF